MPKTSTWDLWTLNLQLMMGIMVEVTPRVRELRLEIKELFLLAEVDKHPSPADLARVLCTPKPTVTFMVKRLEAASYLKRSAEPDDARRSRLTLTASGRRAMEGARAILDEAFGERLGRLSAAERAMLAELLGKMADEGEAE